MIDSKKTLDDVLRMLAYLNMPSVSEGVWKADECPEGFTGKEDDMRYVCTEQGVTTFDTCFFDRVSGARSTPAEIPPPILTRMCIRLYTGCKEKAMREALEKITSERLTVLGISPVRRDKP